MSQRQQQIHRVQVCKLIEPSGLFFQLGEPFPFLFDSGAECSLVKEKLSNKLTGKGINNLVILRGIGDNIVMGHLQMLSQVQISL